MFTANGAIAVICVLRRMNKKSKIHVFLGATGFATP